jgi:uncharacterized protein YqgV (UPF0045/DUF77 family)
VNRENHSASGPDVHLSLQILPAVDQSELYPTIDKVIDFIAASGYPHWVGPMETTIQGPLDEVLKIVAEAQRICEEAGAERIISFVKIDYKSRGVKYEEKMARYL